MTHDARESATKKGNLMSGGVFTTTNYGLFESDFEGVVVRAVSPNKAFPRPRLFSQLLPALLALSRPWLRRTCRFCSFSQLLLALLALSAILCVSVPFSPTALAAPTAPAVTSETAAAETTTPSVVTTTPAAIPAVDDTEAVADSDATTDAGATKSLTLDQSIELALKNNKLILIQKQEVESMNGQVLQARSTAFPNISASTNYVRTQGTMNFGGKNGITFDLKDSYYGGGVSLVQPIYTAGRVGGALKAAHAARGYAQENLKATTEGIVYAVKASFGGVLLARKMSTLAKESLELAEAHLKNVEQFFKQGAASEYELIRAKVQVAQLLPERIKADNEFDRAMIVFRNTLGLRADEKVEPEGDLETGDVGLTTEEAFRLAKENRHELAAARLRVSGMRAALDIAKSDRYPSLSFAASAQMETNEPRWKSTDWRSRFWTASLALSIPMFDGLRTKGKIKQTSAAYEQAILYAAQTEDAVRLEVEQAVSQLAQARQLVQSQVASVEQAQKGLDIANLRYKNGVGTQLEVLDAQVALSVARTNYFMSIYEHFMAVAEIERVTGVDFTRN